jgi:uncharacterized membrane protein YtjA (UPF0391 family)
VSIPGFGAGLVFLALAAVTGLLGFGVVSDDAPLAAKVFSGFFLCSAAGAFWWGRMTRTRSDTPPAR